MFNFFRRQPQKTYVVVARYYRGHWFRQFEVRSSRYEAAASSTRARKRLHYYRINGASAVSLNHITNWLQEPPRMGFSCND